MDWYLFLDDERLPGFVYFEKGEPRPNNRFFVKKDLPNSIPSLRDFTITKTAEEAIELVKKQGLPKFIAFDHDLGKGLNGYEFAKWICLCAQTESYGKLPKGFSFEVHSANIIGAENIQFLMDNILKHFGR